MPQMRILFLSNIPSPYRVDFFNELGKSLKLKVIFEAERNYHLNDKWYNDQFDNFNVLFLKKGAIEEKKVNWQIVKHLKKDKQDLVIVTNYSLFTELVGLLYLKLKKIPYCLEVDGGMINKESFIKKWLKSLLIKNATAYISPSKSTDEYLIYYGAIRNKIYHYRFTSLRNNDILSEIPTVEQKNELRRMLSINEKRVIVSAGQFIHRKGFDVLLKACKNIEPDIGVYIIGGEPTEEYLRLKRDLKLENVYFIGFKTKSELDIYYKAADLFVLPTRTDVWGLVINEAMARGLPVITTDKCVAGLALVNNYENGFIVPVDNHTLLSRRISDVFSEESNLQHMSANSLKIIKNYTIENMVETHLQIFKTIINQLN